MLGLALFLVTSLLAGLSTSSEMLIVARLLQGAAGAILSPSVFSITLVTFAEGAERNKALGILGGIAGSGRRHRRAHGRRVHRVRRLAVDLLRQRPDRRIGARPRPTLRAREQGGRADSALRLARRVSVTGSLMLLVFGLTQANRVGWASAQTIGVFVASAALMLSSSGTRTARAPRSCG